MATGAKGDKIWKELRILHAENIYAILDPQARGSVDVRSAVEELVSGRLVSSLDVANAVIGAATQHAQALGFTDISRIPRAAFIKAVLEVPSEWLSLSYGGTIPAVRSESQLASMSTSAGDTSWHVQPKRLGGGGRAAAAEFPWREDQENIDGLRQSLAQARQLGLELVSKINFAGSGTSGGTPPRRIPTQASAPWAARSTATSRNTSTPGRFAAKYADGADSLWPEDTGLMSALERVADNEFRSETWRAREARSTARKVEKAREALRLAERDGLEAARRIEEAQARLRLQEQNGWKCALRTEAEARVSDDEIPLAGNSKTGRRTKAARSASPVSSSKARAAARQEEKTPSQTSRAARDASPVPSWTARTASGGQKLRGAASRSTGSDGSEEDGFKVEEDHLDQIKKILTVLGTPSEAELEWLPARSPARAFIKKVPLCEKQSWKRIYPKASEDAIDAIEKMLTFDPTKRLDVPACLELKYFESLHMPDDEPVAEKPVDWAFDKFTPTKRLLQNYVYVECARFHPQILERDDGVLRERGIDKLIDV